MTKKIVQEFKVQHPGDSFDVLNGLNDWNLELF